MGKDRTNSRYGLELKSGTNNKNTSQDAGRLPVGGVGIKKGRFSRPYT